MKTEQGSVRAIRIGVMAAVSAVVIATGALVIVLIVIATVQGQTLMELYYNTFPRYRGAHDGSDASMVVRVIFFLYVLGSAVGAMILRARFARRQK